MTTKIEVWIAASHLETLPGLVSSRKYRPFPFSCLRPPPLCRSQYEVCYKSSVEDLRASDQLVPAKEVSRLVKLVDVHGEDDVVLCVET